MVTMVATTLTAEVVNTITIKTALPSHRATDRQDTDHRVSSPRAIDHRAWVDPRRDHQGGAAGRKYPYTGFQLHLGSVVQSCLSSPMVKGLRKTSLSEPLNCHFEEGFGPE